MKKERWLFDEVVDHVGIYGSKGAEGLSAFNAGLVHYVPVIVSPQNVQEL